MKSRILTFLAFLFLLSFSAFAQVSQPDIPADQDDDVVKISTTLIQIDAVVTDKKGNIVTDLTANDFEIYQNGKKQDISNFSFVRSNKTAEKTDIQPSKPNKNAIPIPAA